MSNMGKQLFLNLVLFIFLGTEVMGATDPADCVKPCKSVNDCGCSAAEVTQLGTKYVLKFCTKEKGEDMGGCTYCIRTPYPCDDPKHDTNFGCCGVADYKSKKDERVNVTCRASNDQKGYSRCLYQCHPLSFVTCTDKDGYMSGEDYDNCNGTHPFTWVTCNHRKLEECGSAGAACSKTLQCCQGYECANGKCQRNCGDVGSKCKPPPNRCCKGKGDSLCLNGECKLA